MVDSSTTSKSVAQQPKPDLAEIKRAALILCNGLTEMRIFAGGKPKLMGYYDDYDTLARDAFAQDKADGIYVITAEIDRAKNLEARSYNHLKYLPHTTADIDITRRRWILVDFDPVRESGISSTEDEHWAAQLRAGQAHDYLMGLNVPSDSMIFADSGNGAHLLIRVDLPNNEESKDIVTRILRLLKAEFGSDGILVDQTTFNAARIWKLYGTVARKGDSLPERPHRLSRMLMVPETVVIAPLEILKAIAQLAPEPEQPAPTTTKRTGAYPPFDLEARLQQWGVVVTRKGPYQGGTRYILRECVFDSSHIGTSAAIIVRADGVICYKCQHDHCSDKTWAMVRERFEPGYRGSHNVNTYSTSYISNIASRQNSPEANPDKNPTEIPTSERGGKGTNPTTPLSQRVEEWTKSTGGRWFETPELDRSLGILSTPDKDNRWRILERLQEKGLIQPHPRIAKQFRYVNTRVTALNYKTASAAGVLLIKFPMNIEKYVNIYPGNEIVVAGAPNSGKTAFNLETIYLNQDAFPILYLCSEMGAVELGDRLDKFEGMAREDWKFEAVERASDFADVIKPDYLNIIDYLEMTDNLYEVNAHLTAISHRLGTGACIVSLQKKEGAKYGRGQEFGLEKPKLYLSMDKGRIQIVKGKSWAVKNADPNGLQASFKIVGGCHFRQISQWAHPEEG